MYYNITPIHINKNESRNYHLPWDDQDFVSVINGINLDYLLDYILNMINSPKTNYWKVSDINGEIFHGEIYCAICFYLLSCGLLHIEDQYYYEGIVNGRTKYIKEGTYFNPLEKELYDPILKRLSGWHLDEIDWMYYKVGKGYLRDKKLNLLLSH